MATVTPSIPENHNSHKDEAIRKRTRATAEQLTVLEDTFAVNVSPNSKLRKQLSEQLKMTDRSIQIWFQNRRAKVKHMQKRAQLQMHQASMRAQLYHYQQQHYYLQQHYAPHQRAHSLDSYKYHRSTAAANATATALSSLNEPGLIDQQRQSVPPPSLPYAEMIDLNPDPWIISDNTTINPTHLNVGSYNLGLSISSLSIGHWHRLKMQPRDLECVYQPDRQQLCWNIVDGMHHFRMEIPVASIQQMTYSSPLTFSGGMGMESSLTVPTTATMMGELRLDLYYSPLFFMKHQQEWISCSDFTEHQQASQVLQHTLKGTGITLWQELSALMATCPETQQWIQLISSPSSCSSVSSSTSSGSASSFTDGATSDLIRNSNIMNHHHLQLQKSLSTSLPMASTSSDGTSTSSLTATTVKCEDSFAASAANDFLMDPLLLDPSLWPSTTTGFMIS